jgi:hypothetical protein
MTNSELRPITEIPAVNYAIENIEERVHVQYGIRTDENFRYYLELVLLNLLEVKE